MPFPVSAEQPVSTVPPSSVPADRSSAAPVPANPEPMEKTSSVRILRKAGSSLTPSIKDALAGKGAEKAVVEVVQAVEYSEYENFSEPFTQEQFVAKWKDFLNTISDRPNLLATLSNIPELQEGYKLLLKIGNSVQEEEVRLVKPELIGFLKRELRNSAIELTTSIERIETERMHFNDSEKLKILMEKNPGLLELKQKFNLDFNA